MADFSAPLPRFPNGEPDLDIWLDRASNLSSARRRQAVRVFELVTNEAARRPGLMLVELLLQLRMDIVTVMAGMAFHAVGRGDLATDALPAPVAKLVDAVRRLAATNVLAFHDAAVLASESKTQADNVRHLLVALIDDPRVAVLKLAERVVALRRGNAIDAAEHHLAAKEAMAFFAPLAGRLGIWQLKWALEDLSFRRLYPDQYQSIANKLDGRREARERQVEAIRQDLAFRLATKGIEDAEVQGRAKHIYSIWKKMRHKAIDLAEVYDMQAVRVLVDDVDACYRVMGIVHNSWPHIPTEFDDYIANPKPNGYRSIHTAVFGPMGKMLEVQIRTRTMHEESELGVCAHWAYKDDTGGSGERKRRDAAGSQKMDWLRSLLEWHEEQRTFAGAPRQTTGEAANGAPGLGSEERIFVTTPQGHVLDLAPNATPVDFAYRVHTEIGHRCLGARVDGREVSLSSRLRTGECVEIETGPAAAPRREWLNPALGYVNTARARSKVQSWFRDQLAEPNIQAGRALLVEAIGPGCNWPELAKRAGYRAADDLMLAVGVGEQLVIDLVPFLRPKAAAAVAAAAEPPQEIASGHSSRDVRHVTITGRDRDGLLRDVTTAVAQAGLSLVGAAATADVPGTRATITLDLQPASASKIDDVLAALRRVPDVLDVNGKAD